MGEPIKCPTVALRKLRRPDQQGNPQIRESRTLAPARPRTQAACLQCLHAPVCGCFSRPANLRISHYGAFLENPVPKHISKHRVYLWKYAHTLYIYIYIHIFMYVYIYIYICRYTHVRINQTTAHIYIYIYTHMYKLLYIYLTLSF